MIIKNTKSIEQLYNENQQLLSLIAQYEITIQNLQHQLALFRNAQFGCKTEQSAANKPENLQFDEAELTTDIEIPAEEAQETETITYTRKKKSTGRKALPKSLPYIEDVHDLTDEERQCACGCALVHINDEITEQLDIVPQMTFRVVHIRKKYACKNCEDTIKLAELPKQPIDKSIATAGLLAAVIDSKFNRHMPLYRQEAMFAEAGISITRGTLSNWMIKSSALLTPLVKLLTADILDYYIAYADETPLQVLKEKNRNAKQKSYMWLFSGGEPKKRAFIYQYHNSRAHSIPHDFFVDFNGYLHADCYKAYVELGRQQNIIHVACWAHARRYFMDIIKTSKKSNFAQKIIKLIGRLYQLEKEFKINNASYDLIFIRRTNESQPILIEIKTLLDEAKPKILPKSPLGKAITYTLNHWNALNIYINDGRLEIDNNFSERSIKPFVIGRKNWLFHGNDVGANAGSILFSLIETCKYHKIDVFSWFKYVLSNIHKALTIEQLEALLPYNIDITLLDDMRTIPNIIIPDKGVVD